MSNIPWPEWAKRFNGDHTNRVVLQHERTIEELETRLGEMGEMLHNAMRIIADLESRACPVDDDERERRPVEDAQSEED